jgi:diguanylate cyclase (GGDEF)-like protein/PAS domain S-box-containing protein
MSSRGRVQGVSSRSAGIVVLSRVRRWARSVRARAFATRLSPLQTGALIAIVVVSAGVGVTLWRFDDARDRQMQADWADRVAAGLQHDYAQAASLALGVRALFESSEDVTAEEFARFAAVELPGSRLIGLGWSPRVSGAERARFERTTGIRIAETGPDGAPRPAATRSDYFPLRYYAPDFLGSRAWLGLDVLPTDGTREQARDTGEPRMIPPTGLTPAADAALLGGIILPVYARGAATGTPAERRAALVGYGGATFLYSDLVSRAARLLPDGSRFQLAVDGRPVAGGRGAVSDATGVPMAVGGREWLLRVHVDGGVDGMVVLCAVAGGGLLVALLMWGIFVEIDDRRGERERSAARLAALVKHSTDLIAVVDAEGRIVYHSPAAGPLLGRDPKALVGTAVADLLHPDDVHPVLSALSDADRAPEEAIRANCRWSTAAGGWLHAETTMTNLTGEPSVGGWVLNSRDVSERNVLEAELARQAFHDPLTGLANRALFTDRVGHALARRGTNAAVLFCDLDDFKHVNDTLGHQVGDRVLRVVAERLRGCVRAADTVARLGGDEFAVFLEDELSVDEADELAERIIEAVGESLTVAGRQHRVRCSIGIAGVAEAASADELLRNADVAMYAAKSAGKCTFARYEPQMHTALLDRLSLTEDLSDALRRSEFRVHYQPLVELAGGRAVGVEALARWDHPRRGAVPPAEFIPLAEETGLIVELGEVILVEACRQATRWAAESHELGALTMNVNVSARQLQDPELPGRVRRALRESGLAAERLVLEVTESVLMTDADASRVALAALRALGVRIAIDDFGTGYSSLGYLERIPVDQIKVDRIFIEGIDRPDGEAPLLQAILEIGRLMGLEVTAEGVERAGQARFLREAGVTLAQGYYFSRPLAPGRLRARLGAGLVLRPDPAADGGGGAASDLVHAAEDHADRGRGLRIS